MKAIEPKTEFLKSPEAAYFAEAINQAIVRRGLEVALLQMIMEQPPRDTFEASAKQQGQIDGAKRFISIFINLTEPETPNRPDDSGKLQWHLKPPQHQPQPSAQTQAPPPRRPRKPKA